MGTVSQQDPEMIFVTEVSELMSGCLSLKDLPSLDSDLVYCRWKDNGFRRETLNLFPDVNEKDVSLSMLLHLVSLHVFIFKQQRILT